MKKILIIIGTRPEAIKMVPVVRAIACHPELEAKVCVTGQHRSMLDPILCMFGIKVDYDLNVMHAGQTLNTLAGRIFVGLDQILAEDRPDWVLVHGDTTTTMVGALAAFYRQIPVGHVEAGLRTGMLDSPWPEEGNRRLTDSITHAFFAPTEMARSNLLSENVSPEKIIVTGNTVIDALLHAREILQSNSDYHRQYEEEFSFLDSSRPLLLVTGHRRESFGEGFRSICQALLELEQEPGLEIVYPVHLNPAVRNTVMPLLKDRPHIHLIEPIDYLPFVYLMTRSTLILTDSGGIQEEAPALGKPVLVMRDVTERPEAIEAGTARLVGTETDSIVRGVRELLSDPDDYCRMATAVHPFGDGRAAVRISNFLADLKTF